MFLQTRNKSLRVDCGVQVLSPFTVMGSALQCSASLAQVLGVANLVNLPFCLIIWAKIPFQNVFEDNSSTFIRNLLSF